MAKGIKTGGRKRGTRNKVTYGVKASIQRVFEEIGGVDAFADWAQANKSEFYRHYTKLLPVDIGNSEDGPLKIVIVKHGDN